MPVPTHDEARDILTPERERKLVQAFLDAWDDWYTCPFRVAYSRWPRTRANMVFERLADRLQEQFADDIAVRFVFRHETIKIVFDEFIVVRVKKANSLGVGQNIETAATAQFVDAQMEIDGLAGLKKVEVVYALNRLQTAIRSIVAHAHDGDMQIWVWTLGQGAAGAEIVPFPLPSPPPPTQPSGGADAADEVIRPKRPSKPDEATERD